MAEVYIDEKLQATVDLFAPLPQFQQVLYQSPPLPLDFHTIRILVKGEKNPRSDGFFVNIDAFDTITQADRP